MKHFKIHSTQAASLVAMAVASLPLCAADSIETHWQTVCQVANGHELLVTTVTKDTFEGYCLSIDSKEMSVRTKDNKVVKIARTALSRVEMHRAKAHQFRALTKGVHQGLLFGVDSLLSPWAPIGIVAVPVTLAWGAIAAPFCLLGDLRDRVKGKQEIKVN